MKKKHDGKSVIRSIRVSKPLNEFLKFISDTKDTTANDFIIDKIINTKEYREYLVRKRTDDKTPSLAFD